MKKALAEPPNFGDMVHRRLSGMFESAMAFVVWNAYDKGKSGEEEVTK